MSLVDSLTAPAELFPKEITINGETDTVWVRKLPMGDIKRYVEEHASPELETRINAGLHTLVKCIRNEDGTQLFNFEQAKKFHADGIKELTRVFSEVNTVAEKND